MIKVTLKEAEEALKIIDSEERRRKK